MTSRGDECVGDEKAGDEEAEEADDLVGREGGATDQLHDAVGKDPTGEAADGENNRCEIRGAWPCFTLEEFGLGVGSQDGGTEGESEIRVTAALTELAIGMLSGSIPRG